MVRVFRHYISPVKLTLMAVDFLLLSCVALYIAYCGIPFWFAPTLGQSLAQSETLGFAFIAALTYGGIIVLGLLAIGCYASESLRIFRNYWIRLILVLLVALFLYSGLLYLVDLSVMLRRELAAALMVTVVILPTARLALLAFMTKINLTMKVVLFGGGARSFDIRQQIRSARELGIEVTAIVCMNTKYSDEHKDDPDVYLFDNIPNLREFVRQKGAETIIAMTSARDDKRAKEEMIICKLDGLKIQDLTSFYEQTLGYVDIASLQDEWIIFADGFKGSNLIEYWIKRTSDILVSLLVLLLASPFMIIAGLLVKMTSRGPMFYLQERVGLMGESFNVIKFRTMTATAESAGPQFAAENDPRVTPVGRFLRRTRIDELPQLITVLKGDMSFVGPRPERPYFVDQFKKTIPFYDERHYVKPGITGWAQLRYPYGASEEDTRRKLEYDLYYLKNYSLFLDMLIIMQTARVVLFPVGVR